jgi:hypothetical protein
VVDETPVASFVATTLASGTAAPVASVIVPLSDAVDCADAMLPKALKNKRKEKRQTTFCNDMMILRAETEVQGIL